MRVLIVDDHEVVRNGVRFLLDSSSACEVCGEAVDGQDAIEKAQQLKPDVIVIDISMPNLNGLEATRKLRRLLPHSEVLILSQHESPEMVRQAFSAGARGYVLKSAIADNLLQALEKVSRHQPFFGSPLSGSGDPLAEIGAREIIERSAALELALRESEEAYRSTFELATLGIAHLNPEGRYLRVNRKFCEILDYTAAELLNLKFQDITHPGDLGGEMARIDEILAGRSDEYSIEKRYRRKDGRFVWVKRSVSAVRDSRRKVKYFISVVEDLTERVEAHYARFRLAAIVESSDDAIVAKDLNGIVTDWNGAAERIFGYTAQEMVGKPITVIIPPDLHDEEKHILARLVAGERIEHYETVRMTKAGKRLHVSLTISPVKDAHGNIIGASKIARDITDRMEAENALRALHAELEQRVKERTAELEQKNQELVKQADIVRELSARLLQSQDEERRRIARELHDSAGQILAALQINLLPMEQKVQATNPDLVRPVRESVDLVQQLTQELRTISHLLHPPLLDEAGLPSALRWYVDGYAERSKIAVNLDLSPDLGRLSPEMETTIFRIVQESLTNIHRHSGSPSATIRLDRSSHEIALEIRDQGKGITPGKGGGSRPVRPGVGIQGMRERVRQLGGRLEIRSGTTGTVVLAVLPVEEPSREDRNHQPVDTLLRTA